MDPVTFWVIFGLIILGLILAVTVICCLPFVTDKADEIDWEFSDSSKKVEKKSYTMISNKVQIGASPSTRTFVTRQNTFKTMDHTPSFDEKFNELQSQLKEHGKGLYRSRGNLIVAFSFKAIIELILFVTVVSYPPSLWYGWLFFPSNSTVELGLLFLGAKVLTTFMTIVMILLVYDKWVTFFVSGQDLLENKVNTRTLKTEIENGIHVSKIKAKIWTDVWKVLTWPLIWLFIGYGYILLRILFIWIGSGVWMVDGWPLWTLLALLDALCFVFSFMQS